MPDSLYVRLPNWVGDACMCLPALSLLQTLHLPLVLCGRPWAQDLFAGLAPAAFIPMGGGFAANLRAIKRTRQAYRAPRGVVFPNSLSSAALFRLAGIPAAGYRNDGRGLLLKWPVTKQAEHHEVEVFYRLVSQAMSNWQTSTQALSGPGKRLELPLTAAHRQTAQRVLDEAGIDRPFVLLAPMATGLHHGQPKAWPQFDELARALQKHGYLCLACPPPHEGEQTRLAIPTAQILPPLGLGAFAALAARAALVICNDSGTSHVAAAAGARQITLFGVTRRERTGPWSPDAVCLGSEQGWPALEDVVTASLQCLKARP